MEKISFRNEIYQINQVYILRLPDEASKKLSSRGQVAVEATTNGHQFSTVLEPDGKGGHWMKFSRSAFDELGIMAGQPVEVSIEPTKKWPEPKMPDDFSIVLKSSPASVRDLWQKITPMARWEWIRWVEATNNPDTRSRRIEVSISKMQSGKRRPCCFNLSACTDPKVSKNAQLIEQV